MTNSDGQVPLPDPVRQAATDPDAVDAAGTGSPAAGVSAAGQASPPSELRFQADASLDRAGEWHRLLRQWVRAHSIPAELLADIDLAAYEALANAAMHAYPRDTTGPMSLHAQIVTGEDNAEQDGITGRIVIDVRDEGRWSDDPNRPYSEREVSGRGIPLMRALAPEATVTSTVTGTHVRLAWPWTPPASPLSDSDGQ